jgi:subtilase family protein
MPVVLKMRTAVSLGFPRLAQAGVAASLAVACLALNAASSSAATSSVRSQEWWLQALHVTQAWHSTRAGGVTVAVLDTGVYPKQADLRGAVITGPDYTHSGRASGGPFWGIHGTALASLIAGRGHGTNAGAGVMGVAPAASILSVRVTLESNDPLLADANVGGGLPDAIARGIRYAVNHHASVIDLPLDPVTVPGSPGVGGSSAEKAAVAYALAHHVVLVAPAGDEGAGADPVNFPASYQGVISVGAFDSQFSKASFSSQRPYVTLTAAGVGVIAANGPTGYAQMNSTAAASAVVTGIAALIRAQFPALSPAQVTKALTESARFKHPGGQLDGSGAGTVDAALALAAAAHMAEAVPSAGSSPVAVSPGAQPPSTPAVGAFSNLSRALIIDVGIAVAVFLLLAVPILTYSLRRRRRARAARLAEVRAAAQPAPPRKPVPTRHAAIDTVEPDQYNYIPAPPNQGFATAPSRAAAPPSAASPPSASPPSASPPVPSPAPSSPGVSSPAASSPAASSPAGSSPAMGARMGTNGTGASAQPPWAAWGGQNGTPGSGAPPRAIPGSAFPPPGDQGLPTNPPGRSAPEGSSTPGGLAALMGLAGQAGPGDQAGQAGQTGTAGQAGRRGGSELPLPKRFTGQAGAGRRPAPTDPAETGPAHAGPGAGGIPGWNIPGVGTGPEPGPMAPVTPAGRPGGAPRPGASRAPKVTGSPPWEPAQQPAGEVPWGRTGMPQAGGARTFPTGPQRAEVPMPEPPAPRRPEPAPEPGLSPWDAIAEEAWPGGPHTSRPPAQPAREQGPGRGQGRGSRGGRSKDTGTHPIYVWNPSASTENLPVLPPGENNKQ